MIDYIHQLNDVRWLNKKKKVLARAMFKCEHCGCSDRILEVHHLYYVKDHKAWQYPLKALKALCGKCHSQWHDNFEIVVLYKIRNKRKEFKPPSKLYKHKGPKYFKWQERNIKKVKKIPLVEIQSKETKYKPRIVKEINI